MMQACNPVAGGMSPQTFPVLFTDDVLVLPGMVLPLELTSPPQPGIDAARAARSAAHGQSRDLRGQGRGTLRLLLAPRLDGRSGAMGVVAEVTQIGRLPSGEPAAVL